MGIGRKRVVWILLSLLLFGAGIMGGYLFVAKRPAERRVEQALPQPIEQAGDLATVRIYYPAGDRLVMEERRVGRTNESSLAEETVKELLKGPSNGGKSPIPSGARLLGVYPGTDGVMYLDISDEFRRNFQGDVLAEFFLLKGLYETVISNVKGVDDVKVLIEGKEIESIGGHLWSLYPLKDTLAAGDTR